MSERRCAVERKQSCRLNDVRSRLSDPQLVGRAPKERGVAKWLCRSEKQQTPRVMRQPRQPPLEARLDSCGQRQRRGQPKSACELGGAETARQLQERKRVASRFGHDPLEHGLVQPRGENRLQQGSCIAPTQRANPELWESSQAVTDRASREDERNSFCQQPTRDQCKRSCRGAVQPLRIIDHTQDWLLFARL